MDIYTVMLTPDERGRLWDMFQGLIDDPQHGIDHIELHGCRATHDAISYDNDGTPYWSFDEDKGEVSVYDIGPDYDLFVVNC